MSIKNILVHIDDSGQVDSRLDVAVGLARAHDAHLAAIYAIAEPFIPPYDGAGYIPADLLDSQAERARQRAAEARKHFERRMARIGMEHEWRQAEGDAADVVSLNAKYADLTVVGQADPDDPGNYPNPGLPAEVALGAGRPVLVVPMSEPLDRSAATSSSRGTAAARRPARSTTRFPSSSAPPR